MLSKQFGTVSNVKNINLNGQNFNLISINIIETLPLEPI